MGFGGVAIATLPSVICAKLMFSDGLGGYHARFYTEIEQLHKTFSKAKNLTK